ncbi:hypothetical protein [Lacticaseibacillus manihotivorans]|uniref:hypothetical protein n=1 Tax=Lacticaseibacillus manihotivorans TaxID=88233 RepID=UPI0006CF9D6A|nr:hypothetical protein [Lacticaseibacillus manihotivorans]
MKLKIWSLKIMLGLAGLVIGVFALMLFWRLPRGLTVAYHQAGTAWLMTIGIYVAVVCFFWRHCVCLAFVETGEN